MTPLLVANAIAFLIFVAASVRAWRVYSFANEEGRALNVVMWAIVLLAGLGLVRRSGTEHINNIAFVAWIVLTAVGVWMLLPRTSDRP